MTESLPMPENNYLEFLGQRAAERRLAKRFSQPRLLLLHTIAFVGVATALWASIAAWLRWIPLTTYDVPSLLLFVWSVVLAAHALLHYRRSSAREEAREQVVEAEMRQLIATSVEPIDDESLFALHQRMSGELARKGWLTQALTVFALVNAVSWFGASLTPGTSWGYQLTLPFALLLVGGVYGYQSWRHSRATGTNNWLTRFPLAHLFAFLAGSVVLAVLGAYRMVNGWDVNTLVSGWLILLVLHVVWSVVLAPLVNSLTSKQSDLDARLKRKPAERLMLSDDGEIVPAVEATSEQNHALKHR